MVSEQPNRTEAKRHQPRDSLQYREATQDSQSQESSLNPRRNSPRQLSNRMKCSLSENSSSDIGGSGTIKNSQPRSQTPGNTPTSEGNQKNRINLDEVINIMSSRAEINSPLQYMDRGTADAGGNVRSTATKKTSVLPLRIYKELPVVPLAEFKHPDFPSEEMLTALMKLIVLFWIPPS
ncbi:uncharacterized protein LOC111269561 isoform X2 [Varroa jacobsoni]|uniref:uncharacterized protein LOC111269561 isoform X2 n=1 Tax=Varroa jacobsoni TaxID=62625 RepID=UPI000BF3FAEC|nr:uncharacterized protein LOC111269561 isoform X2 [Varroa jacobsoni]